MSEYQAIFRRYEKKYMLREPQYVMLRERLGRSMAEDTYGLSTICTVYYDTDNYQIIRACGEKPIYKEKLRMRSYGIPGPDDPVYLELKKKYRGVVYKRRVSLSLAAAERYLSDGEIPSGDSQILREIEWFRKYYAPQPKVLLSYERIAFFAPEEPELRITFDFNIRWRDEDPDPSHGDYGRLLLPSGCHCLMEIKIPESMPLWLSRALSEQGVFPTAFSKYGACYQNYLMHKTEGFHYV